MTTRTISDLLKVWSLHFSCQLCKGNSCPRCTDDKIFVTELLTAQRIVTEDKVRRECAAKLESMLEQNLETEEYFGVFGEVNNRQFVEDFKTP